MVMLLPTFRPVVVAAFLAARFAEGSVAHLSDIGEPPDLSDIEEPSGLTTPDFEAQLQDLRAALAARRTQLQDDPFACSHRNLTECCERMVDEARWACLEYSEFGFTAASCRVWESVTRDMCEANCGDCRGMAGELHEQCRFQMQVTGDAELTSRLCQTTATNVQNYRCPSACEMDPAGPEQTCRNATSLQCMEECGNYYGCSCSPRYNCMPPDCYQPVCEGQTVLTGEFNNSGRNHSCWDTPTHCMHAIPEGRCGYYRWCPPDLCIIRNITCVSDNQCTFAAPGACEPSEGVCYFTDRASGFPCNDGLYYTVNDACLNSVCQGTIDYCLFYNVTCTPLSPCLTGGVCHPHNGRCTYTKVADGLTCDDQRLYTVEDRCQDGLCFGRPVDLCQENGVECIAPDGCHVVGTCDPLLGVCSPAVARSGGVCNDNDPTTLNDTCVDGVCLGSFPGGPEAAVFQTLGEGECADRDGRRMGRYLGDVADESACEAVCRHDPQCAAFSFAFPLCAIYGTVRTRPPNSDRLWTFQVASVPAAVIVEQAWPLMPGQRATVCRKRGLVGDVVEPTEAPTISRDEIFGPWTLAAFFAALVACFFLRPMCRCCKWCLCDWCRFSRCCCCRRFRNQDEEDEDEVEVYGKVVKGTPEADNDMLRLAGASGDKPHAALPSSPSASATVVAQQPDGELPSALSPEPPPGEALPALPDGTMT